METITSRLCRFRRNRRGLSNLIVVMLSFIIIVMIVSNVIIWSYQMNQLDWDRMQENVSITGVSRVTRSAWFVTQSDYTINLGNLLNGSFASTQTADGVFESFGESNPSQTLDINGTFSIDLLKYPLTAIQGIEIQLRYRVDDTGEKWYLQAYDWLSKSFSDSGFNSTSGQTPTTGWNNYAVNLTDMWRSYVTSNGRMLVKVHDQGGDSTRTTMDIDFLGIRVEINGALFAFQNKGSRTVHLVSLWIDNSTWHVRYDAEDAFVNAGETLSYQRADIRLPDGPYIVKTTSERGNTAIYIGA